MIENQAAYVAGWLKKLRDDRKLVVHAAAQAQHAANYVSREGADSRLKFSASLGPPSDAAALEPLELVSLNKG